MAQICPNNMQQKLHRTELILPCSTLLYHVLLAMELVAVHPRKTRQRLKVFERGIRHEKQDEAPEMALPDYWPPPFEPSSVEGSERSQQIHILGFASMILVFLAILGVPGQTGGNEKGRRSEDSEVPSQAQMLGKSRGKKKKTLFFQGFLWLLSKGFERYRLVQGAEVSGSDQTVHHDVAFHVAHGFRHVATRQAQEFVRRVGSEDTLGWMWALCRKGTTENNFHVAAV